GAWSALERFRAKWAPVRVKKTRQNKKQEPGSDAIRTGLLRIASAPPRCRRATACRIGGSSAGCSRRDPPRSMVPPSGRRGQIAEALEVCLLLVVARRQFERARGGAAEDVVLALLAQERQVRDRAGQIEVPVRIIRGIHQLGVGVDHAERRL